MKDVLIAFVVTLAVAAVIIGFSAKGNFKGGHLFSGRESLVQSEVSASQSSGRRFVSYQTPAVRATLDVPWRR
jgi:hypothetical protein